MDTAVASGAGLLRHSNRAIHRASSPTPSSSSSSDIGLRKRRYDEISTDPPASTVTSLPPELPLPEPAMGQSWLSSILTPLSKALVTVASIFTSRPVAAGDAREDPLLHSGRESPECRPLDRGTTPAAQLVEDKERRVAPLDPETEHVRQRRKISSLGGTVPKTIVPATQQLPSPQSSEDEAPHSKTSRLPVESKALFQNPVGPTVLQTQREKPFRPKKQLRKGERELFFETRRRRDLQEGRLNVVSYSRTTLSQRNQNNINGLTPARHIIPHTPRSSLQTPMTSILRSSGPYPSAVRRSQRLQLQSGRVEKILHTPRQSPHLEKMMRQGRLYYESTKELDVLLDQLRLEKAGEFKSLNRVVKDQEIRQETIKQLIAQDKAEARKPKGVTPLNAEQLESVETTLEEAKRDRARGTKIFASKNRIDVSSKDLCTLRDNEWLNDEIINFYLNLICERANAAVPNGSKRVFAFNTFFWSKLGKEGYKPVARWAKRQGIGGEKIKELEYLFVPMNMGNMHWVLSLVNLKKKRFEYYDSLSPGVRPSDVFKELRNYMQQESGGMDLSGWEDYAMKNPPRQFNGSDCGVFTVQTAEYISRDLDPTYSATDIPTLRRKMIYEIVNGTLLPRD